MNNHGLIESVGTSTRPFFCSGSPVGCVRPYLSETWLEQHGSAGTRTRNQRLKRAVSYDRYLTKLPISCKWNQREQTKTANRPKKANGPVHSIFGRRNFMAGGCNNE